VTRGLIVCRVESAAALLSMGDDKLLPQLCGALKSDNRTLVKGAALAIGHLKATDAVPNLIHAFRTDDVEVASAVSWALGQCRALSALPWLMAAADHDIALANVCEALGLIGDAGAAQTLVRVLNEGKAEAQAYAAKALAGLRFQSTKDKMLLKERVVPALKASLKHDDRRVRLCAAVALYDLEQDGFRAVLEADFHEGASGFC